MLTCPVPNSPADLFNMFCIVLRDMGLESVYRATVKGPHRTPPEPQMPYCPGSPFL
ncbi:hypothetical protein [Klebsiella pneumoniae]|uniref:hypothetical protein n=1 Tax=Klebsiella pneumoniae TaxID=573 RepID=UPI001E4C0E7F|nr:hypothetical protein [Klebsiella pneumoniae]